MSRDHGFLIFNTRHDYERLTTVTGRQERLRDSHGYIKINNIMATGHQPQYESFGHGYLMSTITRRRISVTGPRRILPYICVHKHMLFCECVGVGYDDVDVA